MGMPFTLVVFVRFVCWKDGPFSQSICDWVSCVVRASPHIRDFKTVWDSRCHAVDSGFQVQDFSALSRRFWISGIADFKAQEFRIPQAKVFRIPQASDKFSITCVLLNTRE